MKTLLGVLLFAAVAALPAHAADDPRRVAEAYFDATTASDLGAAGKLFASVSSIYESGGVEGSWQRYRDHHLGPELDAIESFSLTRHEPEVVKSDDGSLAFVAWPVEYRIVLRDKRVIDSKGTVTFLLVEQDGAYKIRQLHWSSRQKPPGR